MDKSASCALPLPISWEECRLRGWSHLDILLVTGDAFIDHPSFGVALIGRLLESHGFRVAILSQPRFDSAKDFQTFPTPRLFCGITAGNLDSIVANYTGNGKVRDTDAYSPDGNPWRGSERIKTERRRPDRASLIYTSLARSAFRDIPIVLGGIEASLRRFVHYDFKQQKLRSSFLTDAKADLLVYGMGEKAIVEIAKRCAQKRSLSFIAGTCQRFTDKELQEQFPAHFPDMEIKNSQKVLVLPSWEKIQAQRHHFLEAETEIDHHSRAYSPRIILQRQQTHWVVQHPAQKPLSPVELDALYNLPYTRCPHPAQQQIPAFRMIKDSVTIVRGCSGNCSFCAITRHQGPAIISRSKESISKECRRIAQMDDFSGTISDLGGPTANLYGTHCAIGSCKKRDCLYPKLCSNLKIDEDIFLDLLDDISAIDGIKRLFISSGLRMELLLRTPRLLKRILQAHTPGSLKIAPEHTDDELLCLMHKEPHALLKKFIAECRRIGKELGKKNIEFTPYVITAHPGSTPQHAEKLAQDMQKLGLQIRKSQDFTPTPGTLSTAMYVTGLKPGSKQLLTVPRKQSERMQQRRILERSLHRKIVISKKFGSNKKK
jgi:uncharacterized radical SAM protein YgiQ